MGLFFHCSCGERITMTNEEVLNPSNSGSLTNFISDSSDIGTNNTRTYYNAAYNIRLNVPAAWLEEGHQNRDAFSEKIGLFDTNDSAYVNDIWLPIYIFNHEEWDDVQNVENLSVLEEKYGFNWTGGGSPYPFLMNKDWVFVEVNRWMFHMDNDTFIAETESIIASIENIN